MKTFASHASADVFGYVGDVLFPALVLAQFVGAASGGLFEGQAFRSRTGVLVRLVEESWESLPKAERRDFSIVHCGRDGEYMQSRFHVSVIAATHGTISAESIATPTVSSGFALTTGSGGHIVRRHAKQWDPTPAGSTSRAHYWAMADAIAGGADPLSGGSPQLVGLYRRGKGNVFGHVDRERRLWVGGFQVGFTPTGPTEWRDENFERMDPKTRRRLKKAQKRPRPPT